MPAFPPDFPDDVDDTGFDQVITGTGGWDTLPGGPGRDHIIGGNGNDYLLGYGGNDRLEGGNGADRLEGGSGADVLDGGPGNDTLTGGLGADTLIGGAGNDIYVIGFDTGDTITDSGGIDTLISSGDCDLRDYDGIEVLSISGNSGRGVTAIGTDGDDTINMSAWMGVIDAGTGDDTLNGNGKSNEIFIGGLGRDVMFGGYKDYDEPWFGQDNGVDRFDFRDVAESAVGAKRDVILNFVHSDGPNTGGDQLNLGAMDANTTINGNQAFRFIADADFSGTAGELRLQYFDFANDASNYSVISGDVDGDGAADFEIEIHTMYPNSHLTMANDIIL